MGKCKNCPRARTLESTLTSDSRSTRASWVLPAAPFSTFTASVRPELLFWGQGPQLTGNQASHSV